MENRPIPRGPGRSEKLPGYTEALRPEFHSTATDFRVVLKNVNGNMVTSDYDSDYDSDHVRDYENRLTALVDFCKIERTRGEMMASQSIASPSYFRRHYLKPLLESGRIRMTIPEKPKSKKQKYIRAR